MPNDTPINIDAVLDLVRSYLRLMTEEQQLLANLIRIEQSRGNVVVTGGQIELAEEWDVRVHGSDKLLASGVDTESLQAAYDANPNWVDYYVLEEETLSDLPAIPAAADVPGMERLLLFTMIHPELAQALVDRLR